jgi:hypothetical protein
VEAIDFIRAVLVAMQVVQELLAAKVFIQVFRPLAGWFRVAQVVQVAAVALPSALVELAAMFLI